MKSMEKDDGNLLDFKSLRRLSYSNKIKCLNLFGKKNIKPFLPVSIKIFERIFFIDSINSDRSNMGRFQKKDFQKLNLFILF